MELYLIRHASAQDGEDDDARALSDKGRKRFGEVVGGLGALGARFDRVLHSPKLRAVQTAELLAPLVKGEVQVTALLAEAPGPKLLKQVQGEAAGRCVALVGHQPWLGELLGLLLGGDARAGAAYELKKGAVARLEGDCAPGAMHLLALLQPGTLRRVR